MFMRRKGHTCGYCTSIDEAHERRHNEIAEQLQGIYKIADETMAIIPGNDREAKGAESSAPELLEEQLKKRERKEKKRLAKAANRSTVVTLEDRRHIAQVLHEDKEGQDLIEPKNQEEVAEIEKQLRHNANAYLQEEKQKLSSFTVLVKVPGDDNIDFESEMARILGEFRITDLLSRNLKNRGLVGKEQKEFDSSVRALKQSIIDDLLLVKKVELETRMNRAAYLRYTGWSSFEVLQERYAGKNWSTGEKIVDATQEVPASYEAPDNVTHSAVRGRGTGEKNLAEEPSTPAKSSEVDNRHLTQTFRVVGGSNEDRDESPSPWVHRSPAHPRTLSTPKTLVLTMRPSEARWVDEKEEEKTEPTGSLSDLTTTPRRTSKADKRVSRPRSANRTTTESTKSPAPVDNQSAESTEAQLPRNVLSGPTETPPLVGRKKKDKKKKREAQRKARRAAEKPEEPEYEPEDVSKDDFKSEELPTPETTSEVEGDNVEQDGSQKQLTTPEPKSATTASPVQSEMPSSDSYGDFETAPSSPQSFHSAASFGADRRTEMVSLPPSYDSLMPSVASPSPSAVLPTPSAAATSAPETLVIKDRRWIDWLHFTDQFQVECVLPPEQHHQDCEHEHMHLIQDCVFKATRTPDCPMHMHGPYAPDYYPDAEDFFVVYPADSPCQIGPFNLSRAFHVREQLNKFNLFHAKLMVLNREIFLSAMTNFSTPGLQQEEDAWNGSGSDSPLKRVIDTYKTLRRIHRRHNSPVTVELLREALKDLDDFPSHLSMCYCGAQIPEVFDPDMMIIACAHRACERKIFHVKCVRPYANFANTTRWYCNRCDWKMHLEAERLLKELN